MCPIVPQLSLKAENFNGRWRRKKPNLNRMGSTSDSSKRGTVQVGWFLTVRLPSREWGNRGIPQSLGKDQCY